jgi:DNA processing protein
MLTLLNLKGIGPKSVIKLCNRYTALGEIKQIPPSEIKGKIPTAASDIFHDPDAWRRAHQKALRALESAEKLDVQVLNYRQPEYPSLLGEISDPPPVVFIKGNLRTSRKRIACVGTREPSSFGAEVTKRLVRLLSENGWSIVSGLALGIDTLSHEEALKSGGHTIAVLANGLDMVYPAINKNLAKRILDAGGALLSEQVFGVTATPQNLVQRDRIQSGLSVATLVLQTDIQGGTMHTVRFTLMQGRKVYVPFPPPVNQQESKCQGLLALATKLGPELAEIIKADGTYKALLLDKFATSIVARVIRGQPDYPDVLEELTGLVGESDSGANTIEAHQLPLF